MLKSERESEANSGWLVNHRIKKVSGSEKIKETVTNGQLFLTSAIDFLTKFSQDTVPIFVHISYYSVCPAKIALWFYSRFCNTLHEFGGCQESVYLINIDCYCYCYYNTRRGYSFFEVWHWKRIPSHQHALRRVDQVTHGTID